MHGQLTDGFCLTTENTGLFAQMFLKTARLPQTP